MLPFESRTRPSDLQHLPVVEEGLPFDLLVIDRELCRGGKDGIEKVVVGLGRCVELAEVRLNPVRQGRGLVGGHW